MSVNIDDDVVDVISCIALFYEKGKSGLKSFSSEGEISGTTSTERDDIKFLQGYSKVSLCSTGSTGVEKRICFSIC